MAYSDIPHASAYYLLRALSFFDIADANRNPPKAITGREHSVTRVNSHPV
jgi:hypothetical protein